MKQTVNLYDSRFRKATSLLSARSSLNILAAALLTLLLFYGVGQWKVSSGSRRLEQLRQQHAEEALRIVELAEAHPAPKADPQLEAQAQRLAREREAKTRLLRVVSSHTGNTLGFSPHATALARRRVAGLWLREIRIGQGGRELVLVGSALEPELPARLIQQLSQESVFAGIDFRSFRMERSAEDPLRIEFAMSTHDEPQR